MHAKNISWFENEINDLNYKFLVDLYSCTIHV